ncbi:MAG: Hemolysins and related proteins containing CBS domains [uncultured Solirubrobacteraceae bacterium]|uniref:Hemolysins and related proteins containing CBS domains n=1 Tax=uncultured Solirubrobacteraceae bacterium TaxID=1162706 RepID=A0A6J4TCL3_9ACTN|nr:MAG: Hemolysins and related proteins containing CBS domains [uncultured Solirubrobacteraceae bacterium]
MTALLLFAVFVLILLNGFFVAAEFALVRVRRTKMEEDAENGSRRARRVLQLLDDLSRYLAACQVGITLTSLAIGFLGEPAIASIFEGLIGESLPEGVTLGISLFLAYLISTSLHITIGEQVPKIFSINRAEATAVRIARPLIVFDKAFRPFIGILNSASNAMLRLIGIKETNEFEEGGSPEELKVLIAQSLAGGDLDPNEAGMLTGVFHLHEQQARQVMTPAPAVVTADTSEDVETALRRCIATGHTRIVVTEDENQDRVKGIVHANALAELLMAEGPQASFESKVREAPIVPETKPLDDLLADLQRQRTSLAVVIDEYGRTAGIVTVEDIVEEVVGEIDDETDPLGGAVRQLANGDWFVRGHVAITDLADYGLELPSDSEAFNSVGGFVFGELGRLPRRGDTVQHNGYSIRVESVRENRIEAVRIRERRAAA